VILQLQIKHQSIEALLQKNNIKIQSEQVIPKAEERPRHPDYDEKKKKYNDMKRRAYDRARAPLIDYELNKARRIYANADEK